MTTIVGLDLSLASTGVAAITDGAIEVTRITSKPAGTDVVARQGRLYDIRVEVAEWTRGADLVVIEGLAYASKSPHATERAGLWWLVVDHAVRRGVSVAVVPPATRARYATGRGNAAKDQVLAAVVRRYPDVDVTGNDEADALILAAMGARWMGHPVDDVPAGHLAAIAKAAWPEVRERDTATSCDVARRRTTGAGQ